MNYGQEIILVQDRDFYVRIKDVKVSTHVLCIIARSFRNLCCSSLAPSRTPAMKSVLFTLLAAAALTSASPIETEALEKRAVSCLKVGATATATWTNAAGRTCRWTGTVGSNFGTNSVTGGEYV